MGDPKGFMTTPRETPKRRPVDVRIKDWREVYEPQSFEHLQKQRSAQADPDVPEHLAYDTVIPFRFCAPPPPGLLQYCDITYPVCFNDCVDSHSEVQFSLFAS